MIISEPVIVFDQGIVDDFLKRNEIDQAIAYCESMKPRTAQILQTIGQLYVEKKNDLESAINYYKEAVAIQEQVNIFSFFYYQIDSCVHL